MPDKIPNIYDSLSQAKELITNDLIFQFRKSLDGMVYSIYEYNSTVIEDNIKIRKYKEFSYFTYKNNSLAELQNCILPRDFEFCKNTSTYMKKVVIKEDENQFYKADEKKRNQCYALSIAEQQLVDEMMVYYNMTLKEDFISPEIKIDDRCII